MTMRIALIDLGAGSLASVRKALQELGAGVLIPTRPSDLASCRGIVVPGVGPFERTAALDSSWRPAVRNGIMAGVPLLGIGLGQQWLFEGSSEAPDVRGLGLFEGTCLRLDEFPPDEGSVAAGPVTVPHEGWNEVQPTRPSFLLSNLPQGGQAYFTHSYAAPVTEGATATTSHGVTFASAVEKDLVFGVQFHPEESGELGLGVLANFLAVCKGA